MSNQSLVSVVIIFLNAEKYIQEAMESVLAQTYHNWELLLVDDGSTDTSTDIARCYAGRMGDRVRYLYHPGHINRGISASRNLGIKHSKGDYLAFLDADDVWLPNKLEDQVRILDSNSEAGMIYGQTLYWYSWVQNLEQTHNDFLPTLGVTPDALYRPPKLLSPFISGKAAVPCINSLLVRRGVVVEIGGFEEIFSGIYRIYEDQAFIAKVCLYATVFVSDVCWEKYRQHPEASTAIARITGQDVIARQFFLDWLSAYLYENNIKDVEIWRALQREKWRIQYPAWFPTNATIQYISRWVKKWLLRGEERFLPNIIRQRLWTPKYVKSQSFGEINH